MKEIVKLAAALAVIAGAVYAIVKYADKIRELLAKCPCMNTKEVTAEVVTEADVAPAEEPTPVEEAPAAEEAPAEEAPVEEAPAAEEAPAEEPAPEVEPSDVTPEDFAD